MACLAYSPGRAGSRSATASATLASELAADHVEPGVALHNNGQEIVGGRTARTCALLTSACVGNRARVASGPATGATGLVTGKHGGINHVLVDFDTKTLLRLNIGDRVQIYACGLGLQLLDFPQVERVELRTEPAAPLGAAATRRALDVPVTHTLPAAILGSGLGKNSVWRGDVDIQLFDGPTRRRNGLETLRFGDLVAVSDSDTRYGAAWRSGRVTIGVVVHSDSTVSGHGPGVTVLLTGPASRVRPVRDNRANIAFLYQCRDYVAPRTRVPLAGRTQLAKPRQFHRLTESATSYEFCLRARTFGNCIK